MSAEAEKNLIEMAARIREMREIIGYSVEQMAEKTEVSVEDYKAVEARSRLGSSTRRSTFSTSARLPLASTSMRF